MTHIASDWLYFYKFNSKKLANFTSCARAHRDLENEYFLKFAETFLLCHGRIVKKNSKLEFVKYFLYFSKMAKTVFDLKK